MSKVSVVIPCFNAQDTIIETLQSVMEQSYRDFDIIVVDDGSTDNTAMRVWEFRETLSACGIVLHLISQKNRGVSAARNRGVRESTADYIAFLDADDRWSQDKLEVHMQHMQNDKQIGISYGAVRFLDHLGQFTNNCSTVETNPTMAQFFASNPAITTSNIVIRRDCFNQLGGFDETMSFAEDQELVLRVMSSASFTVKGIEQETAQYRTSIGGLSANLDAMFAGWQHLVEIVRQYQPDFVARQLSKATAQYAYYLARRSIRLGSDAANGWYYGQLMLRSYPLIIAQRPRRALPVLLITAYRHLLNSESLQRLLPTTIASKLEVQHV